MNSESIAPACDPARENGHRTAREWQTWTPHALGGALMRKLVGLFAGAAILVGACGGTSPTTAPTSAPSTASSAAPSTEASPSGSGSSSEQPSADTGTVDLFTTSYAPEQGTP